MSTHQQHTSIITHNTRQHFLLSQRLPMALFTAGLMFALTACGGGGSSKGNDDPIIDQTPPAPAKVFELIQGKDNNNLTHPLLSANPGGPGSSFNQSLRSGDVLTGNAQDNIIIGGLGVDIIQGGDGDDIMIGGTEDFNSNVDGDAKGADNRDRAFGQAGDDTFIWAPGDGSDIVHGGTGTDVVILGVIGEAKDAQGNTNGAPFFAVSPPNTEGSQDFDGIHLDSNNQPIVSVSDSPGFCSFEDAVANQDIFEQLNIDHIVRFSIRNIANQFDAGQRNDDDGLRIALTLKGIEFVVCTTRELDANNSNNIEVIDISGPTPIAADIRDLPEYVQALIQ